MSTQKNPNRITLQIQLRFLGSCRTVDEQPDGSVTFELQHVSGPKIFGAPKQERKPLPPVVVLDTRSGSTPDTRWTSEEEIRRDVQTGRSDVLNTRSRTN